MLKSLIKRMFSKWILIFIVVLSACKTQHTTYYLNAESGDDRNNGMSEQQAWQSLSKVKNLNLKPGDRLLLNRDNIFKGELHVKAVGTADAPILIGAYGKGVKPRIIGTDTSKYAVLIYNSEHLKLRDLKVINKGKERLKGRTGVKVEIHDYGTSHGISLSELDVHDVNGSLVKNKGGGSGMLFVNGGDSIISVFDGLEIKDCTIRHCERNGMIWSGYSSRANWHPNKNVVVQGNLIEEVPGDGIVPIGCDGALIQFNLMRDCPATLPDTEAAAGIWPWSCDNTIIQFNEVSDHKAPWDGQGFDSDWNCNNTIIQYNYSHDNEGGFLLVCNDGSSQSSFNAGNNGSIVRFNISVNDAIRTRRTRSGIFSPSIHVAGPVKNTRIEKNIIQVNAKPSNEVDRSLITFTSWGGQADSTFIMNNLFYSEELSKINFSSSTNNTLDGNYCLGNIENIQDDINPKLGSPMYSTIIAKDSLAFNSLAVLLDTIKIGNKILITVNKEKIIKFFEKI